MYAPTYIHRVFIASYAASTRRRAPLPVHFPLGRKTPLRRALRRRPETSRLVREWTPSHPPTPTRRVWVVTRRRSPTRDAFDARRPSRRASPRRRFSFALKRVFVVSNASRVGVLGNHACDASGDTSGDTSGATSADVSLLAPSSSFPLSDDVDPRSVVASARARRPFVFFSPRGKISRTQPRRRTSAEPGLASSNGRSRVNALSCGDAIRETVPGGSRAPTARRRRGSRKTSGTFCGARRHATTASLAGAVSPAEGAVMTKRPTSASPASSRARGRSSTATKASTFGRVAVFRGASRVVFVDPGENLDGTVRGAGGPCSGVHASRRKPLVASARETAARAGRATPVARKDQTRARPIDDGAEVIQELGLKREAWEGGGRVSRPSSSHVAKTNRRRDTVHTGSATARRTFGSPTPRPRRGRALSSRLETARGDVVRERSDRERGVAVETYAGRGSGVAGVRRALVRFSR